MTVPLWRPRVQDAAANVVTLCRVCFQGGQGCREYEHSCQRKGQRCSSDPEESPCKALLVLHFTHVQRPVVSTMETCPVASSYLTVKLLLQDKLIDPTSVTHMFKVNITAFPSLCTLVVSTGATHAVSSLPFDLSLICFPLSCHLLRFHAFPS